MIASSHAEGVDDAAQARAVQRLLVTVLIRSREGKPRLGLEGREVIGCLAGSSRQPGTSGQWIFVLWCTHRPMAGAGVQPTDSRLHPIGLTSPSVSRRLQCTHADPPPGGRPLSGQTPPALHWCRMFRPA